MGVGDMDMDRGFFLALEGKAMPYRDWFESKRLRAKIEPELFTGLDSPGMARAFARVLNEEIESSWAGKRAKPKTRKR